jgi:hypothetical protein
MFYHGSRELNTWRRTSIASLRAPTSPTWSLVRNLFLITRTPIRHPLKDAAAAAVGLDASTVGGMAAGVARCALGFRTGTCLASDSRGRTGLTLLSRVARSERNDVRWERVRALLVTPVVLTQQLEREL